MRPKRKESQQPQRGKPQGTGLIVFCEPGKVKVRPVGKVDKERKAGNDEEGGEKPQIGLDEVNAFIVIGQVQGHQGGRRQAVPKETIVDPLDKGNRKSCKVQQCHEEGTYLYMAETGKDAFNAHE